MYALRGDKTKQNGKNIVCEGCLNSMVRKKNSTISFYIISNINLSLKINIVRPKHEQTLSLCPSLICTLTNKPIQAFKQKQLTFPSKSSEWQICSVATAEPDQSRSRWRGTGCPSPAAAVWQDKSRYAPPHPPRRVPTVLPEHPAVAAVAGVWGGWICFKSLLCWEGLRAVLY